MKVTLIDYGAGNVTSVSRCLLQLGVEPETAGSAAEIRKAERLILPGVGHCAALINALDTYALRQAILDAVSRGIPLLGICLGLQALYASSEEAPALRGLELLQGNVSILPKTVKLPHMGWNRIRHKRASNLLQGISPDAYFYFAHSYAAPSGAEESVASCEHGREFTAVIERDNLFGVQFHPEKSGSAGAQLLRNFLKAAA